MDISSLVRGEPGQYVAGSGVIRSLEERLHLFQRPVIVTGKASYAAFLKHYGRPVSWPVLTYDGTASHEDMARLAAKATRLGADVLVGIGGGKVMDTTKGTADRLGIDHVLIPTLVATCACSTPVIVVYHPNHQFKEVNYAQRSGFMTLVDYELLIQSPRDYLLSGISDTLAKWYELEIIHRQAEQKTLPAMVQLALATARVTREILLADTATALKEQDNQIVGSAFQRIVDTVYAVSANVGCQTSIYVSGAHALHNGLTALAETQALQHGLKVAYGVLVQLCVTGDGEEVERLLPFYKANGFPYRWAHLGVTEEQARAQERVALLATAKTDSYGYVRENIAAEDIIAAMARLEELASHFDEKEAGHV